MHLRVLLLLALFAPLAAHAQEAPPSDGSLRELLQASEVHKDSDNMMTQMDAVMKRTMQQVTQGKAPTPEEQKRHDAADDTAHRPPARGDGEGSTG
jgi:hypothetical protein